MNQNSTAKGRVRKQRQEGQAGQENVQRLHCSSRLRVGVKNQFEHRSPEATLEGDPGAFIFKMATGEAMVVDVGLTRCC